MNEKLEAALNGLVERLEKTEKFVLDQAPSVCQEIILEKLIEWGTTLAQQLLACVLLFATVMVAMHNFIGAERDDFSHNWPIIVGTLGVCGLVGLSFGIMYVVSNIMFVKKCPKLILLREFRRLLKQ